MSDEIAFLPLTHEKQAVVDARFLPALSGQHWYAWRSKRNWYARRYIPVSEGKGNSYLHQVLWRFAGRSIPPGMMLDHCNGNGLDNRLDNLRLVTNRQNTQNRSSHRAGRLPGAYRWRNRWRAMIQVDGKRISLGVYGTEQEAHKAYMEAAQKVDQHTIR